MVRRVVSWLVIVVALAAVVPLDAQQVGPARGALVLVGGAMRDPAILDRFLTLAGGREAPIVLIPTAGGAESYDQDWPGAAPFRAAGASRLTVLHTTDRAVADTDAFSAPIREAGGVWFGGGRQWRLADAYLDTRVHDELRRLLERGGVGGGSSAGATILVAYLVRGDTRTNTIMMGDHEEGFGLLRGVGVDQHLLRRNRHFDMVEVIRARPELLGIGIDEDTAIVVRGDAFEVIGAATSRSTTTPAASTRAPRSTSSRRATPSTWRRGRTYRADPTGRVRPLDRVVAAPWPAEAR